MGSNSVRLDLFIPIAIVGHLTSPTSPSDPGLHKPGLRGYGGPRLFSFPHLTWAGSLCLSPIFGSEHRGPSKARDRTLGGITGLKSRIAADHRPSKQIQKLDFLDPLDRGVMDSPSSGSGVGVETNFLVLFCLPLMVLLQSFLPKFVKWVSKLMRSDGSGWL